MRQLHAIVTGRVQGVGFRFWTEDVALSLGLDGFVRNLPDGSVEVVARGPQEPLDELVRSLHRGPGASRVAGVSVTWDSTVHVEDGFRVRY